MALRKLGDSAYLYPGSPSTLIRVHEGRAVVVDPGLGKGRHKDLKRQIKKLNASLGFQLATHGHADHVAVSPKLGVPLFVHRHEFSIAESPLNRGILTFGSKAPKGFLAYSTGEVIVHAVFEWNDELFGMRAIRLNGHSPGMTGFVDEENGLVYSGDALFGKRLINSVGIPYFVDAELFKESLGKLRSLAEKGYTLIPSHGPVVSDKKAVDLIEFNLQRVEDVEKIALELLSKPMNCGELAFRLMKHYNVEITPRRLALNLVPVRAIVSELYNKKLIKGVVENDLKWVRS
ncbi:MBL fold metallo-hydrolase [Thermococcus sp.]